MSNQVSTTLRKRVRAAVTAYMKKAENHYGRTLKHPGVFFTQRGTTAGTANNVGGIPTVNYNAVLLNENVEDFIARTVPHEVAHVIDMQINPQNFERKVVGFTRTGRYRYSKRDIHGADFKFIMERVLGVDDSTRCHKYDTSNVGTRKRERYVWICDQRPDVKMELGPKQHKKQLTADQSKGLGYMPRGEGVRRGVHTFSFSHKLGEQPAPATIAADTPKKESASSHKRPKRRAMTTGMSKLDLCRNEWLNSGSHDRQVMIGKFVGIGCTPAGAATYYAKIKKEMA